MNKAAEIIRLRYRNTHASREVVVSTLVVVYYSAIWFFYLSSWFLVLFALSGFSVDKSFAYIACVTLAWIAGVLVFLFRQESAYRR